MDKWLEDLGKKEIDRQLRVQTIRRLTPAFLDKLLDCMEKDIAEFRKSFPRESILAARSVSPKEDLLVIRSSSKLKPELKATVKVIPEEFYFTVLFSGIEWRGRSFLITVMNETLQFDDRRVEIQTLSRFILSPILFPDLIRDSSLKKYFEI